MGKLIILLYLKNKKIKIPLLVSLKLSDLESILGHLVYSKKVKKAIKS
jgi:hypothetical protein